jgi:hypothetical protein
MPHDVNGKLTRQDVFGAKQALEYLEKYSNELYTSAEHDEEDIAAWRQCCDKIASFASKLDKRLKELTAKKPDAALAENDQFGIRNIENEQIAEKILAVLMGKGKIPAMKGGNEKESIKAEIADVLDQVKPGMNESIYKKALKALIREAKK